MGLQQEISSAHFGMHIQAYSHSPQILADLKLLAFRWTARMRSKHVDWLELQANSPPSGRETQRPKFLNSPCEANPNGQAISFECFNQEIYLAQNVVFEATLWHVFSVRYK